MSFKEKMLEVWEEEKRYLESIDPVNDEELYKMQLNRVNELEKRLTDLEKEEIGVKEKSASRISDANIKREQIKMEKQVKMDQIKSEKRAVLTKNLTDLLKIVITTGAAVGVSYFTMKFEDEHIMPFAAGKAAWQAAMNYKH